MYIYLKLQVTKLHWRKNPITTGKNRISNKVTIYIYKVTLTKKAYNHRQKQDFK